MIYIYKTGSGQNELQQAKQSTKQFLKLKIPKVIITKKCNTQLNLLIYKITNLA